MKFIRQTLFFIVFYTLEVPVSGQHKINSNIKENILLINEDISLSFINSDIEKIVSYYDKESLSMPEYQPVMKGIDAIREYYTEILIRRDVSSYKKSITDFIDLESRIVEAGTFTTTYKNKSDNSQVTLDGKYVTIWNVQKNGKLKIESEAFGYFKNLDDPKSHVVKISKDFVQMGKVIISQKDKNLEFQLKALNLLNAEAVKTRDGNLAADFFTDDGIFMPFADSAKRGMNSIRPHMIKYNSGEVTFDTINVDNFGFVDCGKYLIEYSNFYVKWHVPNYSQTVTGKGIRIWRREPDYTFKRLLEIGTHDLLSN